MTKFGEVDVEVAFVASPGARRTATVAAEQFRTDHENYWCLGHILQYFAAFPDSNIALAVTKRHTDLR